jgi:diacylglycerol kinase family enzyme
MAKKIPNSQKYKVIYNPQAGKKKKLLGKPNYSLEDIQDLLTQYQIPADYYPTKSSGHATKLAHDAIKQKYAGVLAAGGDGTVSEAASGLINTDMLLGVLPLGTYMNTAKMLAIPTELEKAVIMIKINRTRKIFWKILELAWKQNCKKQSLSGSMVIGNK